MNVRCNREYAARQLDIQSRDDPVLHCPELVCDLTFVPCFYFCFCFYFYVCHRSAHSQTGPPSLSNSGLENVVQKLDFNSPLKEGGMFPWTRARSSIDIPLENQGDVFSPQQGVSSTRSLPIWNRTSKGRMMKRSLNARNAWSGVRKFPFALRVATQGFANTLPTSKV